MLNLAIQKSGRLNEVSLDFIEKCGISLPKNKISLRAEAYNFPLQVLFLRDDDIPACVFNGVADVGIVGENEVAEKGENVEIIKKLGFSKCRLSLAVPKDFHYENLHSLNGVRIATSYPHILKKFLEKNNIDAQIYEISGSVEIAPSVGLADVIFDIVSSGSTLMTNGLREIKPAVMESEAVLIAQRNLSPEKRNLLDKFCFRMDALLTAKSFKYIMFNFPNNNLDKITKIIPGMKSPTIVPLDLEGWSALHSVVEENLFWTKIDALKEAGAEDMVILPIEKMIK